MKHLYDSLRPCAKEEVKAEFCNVPMVSRCF